MDLNVRRKKIRDGIRKPEISIIIPVYNISKYLRQCLDSIKRQNFKEWECIVINDGSTDNSGKICDEFAASDDRFRIVHKENEGLSSARNAGLELIKGDYVAFVDSDDWIEENYLSSLRKAILTTHADVAVCGYVKEFKSFRRKKYLSKQIETIENERVALELLKNKTLPSFAWNKLYKKSVITDPFPKGMVYEDFYALTKWAKHIKKIVIIPDILYHYRMRKGSITLTNNISYQLDFIKAIKHRSEEISKILYQSEYKDEINAFLYKNFIERAKLIARNDKESDNRDKILRLIADELIAIPKPEKKILSKKILKRTLKLTNNPDVFVKNMKLAYMLDLHSRFCFSQTYE